MSGWKQPLDRQASRSSLHSGKVAPDDVGELRRSLDTVAASGSAAVELPPVGTQATEVGGWGAEGTKRLPIADTLARRCGPPGPVMDAGSGPKPGPPGLFQDA